MKFAAFDYSKQIIVKYFTINSSNIRIRIRLRATRNIILKCIK